MSANRPLSIRSRLALVVATAAVLALAWVVIAVVFYEATNFRVRAMQRLQSQATVLGAILQPALDFADPDGALRYLKAYRLAQREFAAVAVYGRTGRIFASDVREGSPLTIPAAAGAPVRGVEVNQITLLQPIERDRQALGYVYLVEDLPSLAGQYNIIAAAVILALAVMGAVLFGGLQRYFLGPLAGLVETASRIAANKDYSIRASVARDDEIGRLAESFNHMIEVVGRRDAALRESEERMRRLASAAFEGIVISEGGRILELNDQAAHMFGWQPAEVVGRSMVEFAAPESRAAVEAVIREGTTDTYEAVGVRRDGSTFLVEGRVQVLFYQGRPARVSALRDITERKKAEEALRRSEEKFSKAFLASATALIITRLKDGQVIEVNEAFEKLSGFRRDEMIGRTALDLGTWARAEDRERAMEQFVREGSLRDMDFEFVSKDRQVSIGRISAQHVTISGEPCMLTTVLDLTESKRAEAEHARLESQLQQAQKMEAVGRLAGGVAHDFNNMLTVILGQAELALMQDPTNPLCANLVQIQQAGEHSAELTRQLLAFARRQTIIPRVLDLNATVAGMLGMLQRLIGEDIDLVWQPGGRLWRVKIDPAQVDQILANLCVNARDAIRGVGKVTIETSNVTFNEAYCTDHPDHLPGSFAMLALSDNGRGIDRETIEHIFEPFFTTKNPGEGTGLGLATVFGIVKQNEGFLTVYSEPGVGTTFKIYFPKHAGDMTGEAGAPGELPRGRGETVLLVEDEPAILRLGRTMIERLGYTVLSAGTPGEAIRLAESNASAIRLLITDVVMPGMNGRELAERIMQIKPGLRCLFVSGYTSSIIAIRGVLDEGVRFLQKPFSMADLALKIRDALDAG